VKKSHALAHLRHLSCLGLGGEVVIPHMLVVLKDLIGANVAGFHWTDPNGRSTNVHATEIMPSTIDLFVNHYDLLQRPGEISVEMLARGPLPVGNLDRWYAGGKLQRTVLFNEIFVPERSTIVLDVLVRSGSTPRGMLIFGRGCNDREFTASERRMLVELAPWFLHALEGTPANSIGFVPGDERTVILCDGAGQVLSSDPNAVQMLQHAGIPIIAERTPRDRLPGVLPPALRRLCTNAREICAGRAAERPMARMVNCWGAFSFHAHAMKSEPNFGQDELVALTICWEQPREIRALNRLKATSLPPRQRELALHLSLGRRPEDIRARMGISRATYRAYAERVYSGLDVHNRAELAMRLSA
jgi:DNA-binding CsgD family transcriptional regulator